jgi:hypothetical protein
MAKAKLLHGKGQAAAWQRPSRRMAKAKPPHGKEQAAA